MDDSTTSLDASSQSLHRRKSIALLDLHSVFGGSWVGCDCDVVPELAKGSCQHTGALLLSLGVRFGALLDKSNPFVQDLPNHAAESMGDCPDGGLIAEPRYQTPEHRL